MMIVKEKTISSDRIYTGKTISLKVDTVEIENRGYQKREIVEHLGAVGVVALTDENKVILYTTDDGKSRVSLMSRDGCV